MLIRPATAEDCTAIGSMHVQSWWETYPGLMPDSVLARRDPTVLAERWRSMLEVNVALFVACKDERVVGFCAAGPRRPDAPPLDGEIHAIYLLAEAQSNGTGRALFQAGADSLRARGLTGFGLWVLAGNSRAIRFYERMGGQAGPYSTFTLEGTSLQERSFLWPNCLDGIDRSAHG